MAKMKIRDSAILALPITLSVFLVSWVFNIIGISTTGLFATIPSTSALTSTIGTKITGYLVGIIPFTDPTFGFGGLFLIYVGAFVLVLAGNFISEMKVPTLGIGKPNVARVMSLIIWGAIPVYVFLLWMGNTVAPLSAGLVIGLIIHTFVVSFVAAIVADYFRLKA